MDWHSEEIEKIVRHALDEDIGRGDASTAATTPPKAVARAHILARQTLVCAGLPLAENVFRALDSAIEVVCLHADGSFVEPGAKLVEMRGNAAAILTGERTALNFLSHLCGIATYTRRFVEQLATTKTRIRDTRNVRNPSGVFATRYHAMPLATSPSGSTTRSLISPFGLR